MVSAVKIIGVLYILIGAAHSVAFDWLLISRSSCLTATGLVGVYCNSGKGIAHFAVSVAWPLYWLQPNESYAQHLTGADRRDFVAGTIGGCMRKYGQDGTDVIPRPLFEQYCQCYANGLADRLSAKEIKEEKPEIVQPVIRTEGRRCYDAMKEDAMRRARPQSN